MEFQEDTIKATKRKPATASWAGVLLFATLGPSVVGAQSVCGTTTGKIVSIQGKVELLREPSNAWQAAGLNAALCKGDTVRVGAQSRAALMLVNDAVLRLDQNTTLRLVDVAVESAERSWIDLLRGALQSFSRKPRLITVNTPYLNGSIEGTEFVFRVDDNSTQVAVYEGTVIAANAQGSVAVTGGAAVSAANGQAPVLRTLLKPREGAQWTLYYPPVFAGTDQSSSADLTQASRLLQVGQADEAEALVAGVLQTQPRNADALSLQSIILLTLNEGAAALASAQAAHQAEPKSATAALALSYAQQANFDLQGARATLIQAAADAPSNALIWARLAELHASFADLDAALAAATRAAEIAPDTARAQTVLGFSQLQLVATDEALAAFDKAIQLDQADPLPHLGKGLAIIRNGDLVEGRREIEIAAGLDGNNALIRSYLGKAYFEEGRVDLAESQYDTAKLLDSNDPTPFFYDAILKQLTNQPVAALENVQQAIALNDNRAVYRSRLLLDADSAARSAGLARVYSDLGFQDLALVEGWKSVNTDPGNYSAHRFLADSYASRSRHEIARVSELLQSQLLQPLNSTPIQPRIGESNLFLISAGGPTSLSFNEFNQLFSRDGASFQLNGMTGSHDTNSAEFVAANIADSVSVSMGVSHFETDGWRDNAFQKDDIATVFVQKEFSPDLSIQAEYRHRHTKYGDLLLRFFPDEFYPGQKNEVKRDVGRIGGRYDLTPNSTLLASLQYQSSDTSQIDEQYPVSYVTLVDLRLPENAYASELQYLLRAPWIKLISGIGYFHVNGTLSSTIELDLPPPPDGPGAITQEEETLTNVRHTNLYSYGNLELIDNLTLTLGVSADIIRGDFPGEEKSKINPKFGLVWNPAESTTIRAAAFKTLKRTLVTNQTLEPTQVAGFNQFFDDYNLTEITNYGAAIDRKFSATVFGGVEYTRRDLNVPYLDYNFDPPTNETAEWKEHGNRAYLFWTPTQWVALSAQHQYEYTERGEAFPEGLLELKTRRTPLEIKLFSPAGWSASLRGTRIKQNGTFALLSGDTVEGDDHYWLLDASFSYRLPRRLGMISVGASNLTNEDFHYFDRDLNNASIQPKRTLFARLTLAFQ